MSENETPPDQPRATMDRETANQLADELIKSEKNASSEKRRHDSPRARGSIGIGHFVVPVVLTSVFTWFALLLEVSGLLSVAIGTGVGIASSHLIIKHVL